MTNIEVIADDILIYGSGSTKTEAIKEHDAAFVKLLNRARERSLKLNKAKLKFKMTSVGYMGHIISDTGLSADPEKIRAIKQMPKPTDIQGIQRLIGMANYLSKFLPNLSDTCEPLRRLCDKDTPFEWLSVHDTALDKLRDALSTAPVLRYYDVNLPVTIECDASSTGLGCVLLQEGQPVSFASRALSRTEQNYCQLEKECLAICFACERFDHFCLGKPVTVLSDHKPLENIFKKSILVAPKRLQRMRLRLQKYDLTVVYKQGPEMYISDALSRAYLERKEQSDKNSCLVYQISQLPDISNELEAVNMVEGVSISDDRLSRIRDQSSRDETLQVLIALCKSGWPIDKKLVPEEAREYWPYRDEISASDGLLFRGTRVIIPKSMRAEMLHKSHSAHQGISATQRLSRDIIYWPRMMAEISDLVSRCDVCQTYSDNNTKEPMLSHPVPVYPYQVVSSDLFEHRGRHYAVIVDHFSDFIDFEEIPSETSNALVKFMKRTFAIHGIPSRLISDNGPCYKSEEFRKFAESYDFKHDTSSPHYPQSNGRAEAAVKVAKTMLIKATADKRDIYLMLLEQRNTPTEGLASPAQRLMSRRTRSSLPAPLSAYEPVVVSNTVEHLVNRKRKNKLNYDQHSKPLPELAIGQPVRVKTQPPSSKKWSTGIVTDVMGSRSYEVDVEGRTYRRNRHHIKDSPPNVQPPRDETATPLETSVQIETVPPIETVEATPQVISSAIDQPKVSLFGRTIKPVKRLDL